MIKERTLELTGRKQEHEIIEVNVTDFPSPFRFPKLCLMVEANIIIMSALVLN